MPGFLVINALCMVGHFELDLKYYYRCTKYYLNEHSYFIIFDRTREFK